MLCSFRRWHLEMTKLPFRPKNKWLHGEALLGTICNGASVIHCYLYCQFFSPAKHSSEMDVYWFSVSSFFLSLFFNLKKPLQIWSQNTHSFIIALLCFPPPSLHLIFFITIIVPNFLVQSHYEKGDTPRHRGAHSSLVHLTDTSTVADWWPWQLCCQEKWQVYS